MSEKNKKILIIEDELMLTDMYKLKFSEKGYQVFVASRGLEGYEMATKEDFDIILLDIILPEMDGFEIMEKLKQNSATNKIPVVFLTNLKQDEDLERGKKLGAVDYWVKASLTPSEVLDRVEKILKK